MPRAVCHVPALVLPWNRKHRQHHQVSTVGVIRELCFNGFVKNRDLPGLCNPGWCAGAPLFLLTGKMRDLWSSGAVSYTVNQHIFPHGWRAVGHMGISFQSSKTTGVMCQHGMLRKEGGKGSPWSLSHLVPVLCASRDDLESQTGLGWKGP